MLGAQRIVKKLVRACLRLLSLSGVTKKEAACYNVVIEI